MDLDKTSKAMLDRPTYDELLALYFEAEHGRICEWSGNIRDETLTLWRKCLPWADDPSSLADLTGMVKSYLNEVTDESQP